MKPAITTKRQMYKLLGSGELGNFNRQWFDYAEWWNSPERTVYPLWGIRSMTGGGDRRMRLNCPTDEVHKYLLDAFNLSGFQISPMLDQWVTIKGQMVEGSEAVPGLFLNYVPPGMVVEEDPWRGSFQRYGRHVSGSAAIAILKTYLWPDDFDWVRQLMQDYPGHAVEFSACSRAVGVLSGSNTVIWEVRLY